MRTLPFTLLFSLFISLTAYTQDAAFMVELAAFNEYVELDYFQGIDNVQYHKDHNDIHRYFIGYYDTEEAAKAKEKEMEELGYNARVINILERQKRCAVSCAPSLQEILKKIRNIFFDFDKSFLRPEAISQLSQLTTLMYQNPGYVAVLHGHTDAKGSDEYNIALSRRRVDSAKDYLLRRGIPEDRIETEYFGKKRPVAKNELPGGRDTEVGRQFNRRVEILVKNNKGEILNDLVEDIDVPEYLKPE